MNQLENKPLAFQSIDEIQLYYLEKLFKNGEYVITRDFKTLELFNVNFCLTNPRNRTTNIISRKWNLSLALGEFAWHLSGSNNLDFITYYAREWKNFSADGLRIDQSCYGHKIFGDSKSNKSQWSKLVELLKTDKYSRRAVLNLYDSQTGLDYFAKDIACACILQFLIRDNKLNLIVTMRSNDIIWGLPYDIYLFTMLQELLSLELEVDLGNYYHNIGSFHIYEHHFPLGEQMLNENYSSISDQPSMSNKEDMNDFLKYEELIRTSDVDFSKIKHLGIDQYWKDLLFHLWEYKTKKILQKSKTN
jgi:thymidylate synthase